MHLNAVAAAVLHNDIRWFALRESGHLIERMGGHRYGGVAIRGPSSLLLVGTD